MFGLEGKVAIVTGASRGLGKTMAVALAQAGAHVVCVSRSVDTLTEVAKEITDAGFKASVHAMDCGDEAAIKAGVAAIAAEYGGIHILVNNAGVIRHGPAVDTVSEDWLAVIDVNLNGCFYMARECAAQMIKQQQQPVTEAPEQGGDGGGGGGAAAAEGGGGVGGGGGRIINTLSALSVLGRAGVHAYVASKHALHGLTKSLAAELGPKGITVNGIGPGYIRTEMTGGIQKMASFDKLVRSRTAVMRWGAPGDMAGAVVFLASAASAYVTGHMLMVDGGFTSTLSNHEVD